MMSEFEIQNQKLTKPSERTLILKKIELGSKYIIDMTQEVPLEIEELEKIERLIRKAMRRFRINDNKFKI